MANISNIYQTILDVFGDDQRMNLVLAPIIGKANHISKMKWIHENGTPLRFYPGLYEEMPEVFTEAHEYNEYKKPTGIGVFYTRDFPFICIDVDMDYNLFVEEYVSFIRKEFPGDENYITIAMEGLDTFTQTSPSQHKHLIYKSTSIETKPNYFDYAFESGKIEVYSNVDRYVCFAGSEYWNKQGTCIGEYMIDKALPVIELPALLGMFLNKLNESSSTCNIVDSEDLNEISDEDYVAQECQLAIQFMKLCPRTRFHRNDTHEQWMNINFSINALYNEAPEYIKPFLRTAQMEWNRADSRYTSADETRIPSMDPRDMKSNYFFRSMKKCLKYIKIADIMKFIKSNTINILLLKYWLKEHMIVCFDDVIVMKNVALQCLNSRGIGYKHYLNINFLSEAMPYLSHLIGLSKEGYDSLDDKEIKEPMKKISGMIRNMVLENQQGIGYQLAGYVSNNMKDAYPHVLNTFEGFYWERNKPWKIDEFYPPVGLSHHDYLKSLKCNLFNDDDADWNFFCGLLSTKLNNPLGAPLNTVMMFSRSASRVGKGVFFQGILPAIVKDINSGNTIKEFNSDSVEEKYTNHYENCLFSIGNEMKSLSKGAYKNLVEVATNQTINSRRMGMTGSTMPVFTLPIIMGNDCLDDNVEERGPKLFMATTNMDFEKGIYNTTWFAEFTNYYLNSTRENEKTIKHNLDCLSYKLFQWFRNYLSTKEGKEFNKNSKPKKVVSIPDIILCLNELVMISHRKYSGGTTKNNKEFYDQFVVGQDVLSFIKDPRYADAFKKLPFSKDKLTQMKLFSYLQGVDFQGVKLIVNKNGKATFSPKVNFDEFKSILEGYDLV